MEAEVEIQEPELQQEPDPPKKKLWKSLSDKHLYTKSYEDFGKQFSTPESIDKLHKVLSEKQLYTKNTDDFKTQFFSDLTPPVKKKSSIDFGGSSMEAGNVLSQSNGVGGSPIPTIEMYTLPSGEMIETDPVSVSKKYKELSGKQRQIRTGGEGAQIWVPDEEAEKSAKKIAEDFKGLDIEGIYEDTKGLSDDLIGLYKKDILPDRDSNSQLYQRKLSNIKWRSGFEHKLLDDVDKGNIDPENYNRIKHGIEQLPISTSQGDYSNQRGAIKSLAEDIRMYGGENKDELLKDFAVEVSKAYGNPDNKATETFKDSPESQYLTPEAQLGYQYLQDISPDRAEQYKRLFIDPKSLKDKPDEKRGYDHLMLTLEETGLGLKQNAVTEELNSLNKQAELNGGLSPEQIDRATKLEKVNEELSAKRNELDSKYPERIEDKVDDALQEIRGQKTSGFLGLNYVGGKAWLGIRNTAQGIWEAASTPFMSDQSNTMRELAIMGESLEDEKIYHKTDKNKSINYDTMVIQPELQKQIDEIKNNGLLTNDAKEKKLYTLLRENTDKFGRVPIKGGKFNINPSSVMYGLADLGTSLLPFVAIETATGGIGGAGVGAKFLRTFTAAAATTFHDEYANAIREGRPQSEAYKSAMSITAINSLAMAGAGTPTEIRVMANGKTSAGKLINSMSDDAIQKVLDKGTPKGLKGLANNIKERAKATPEMFKQGVKTGAKFEAYMSAANAINGREQDFKRSLVAIGEFGILGAALGQLGFKSPTQLQKSAGIEFGKKPDEYIAIAEAMKKDGQLTETEFNQRTELIKSYEEAYKNIPKNLDEKQQSEYLYETVIKNEATKGKSNLPPRQAAAAEKTAAVADHARGIILDNPTDKQLQDRKGALERKLEPKKDAEGKSIELPEKEKLDFESELEAINNTIEKRKDTSIKEEELPDLSVPIEGTNEKGIPIGENVPAEVKGEPEKITQPIELSVEGKTTDVVVDAKQSGKENAIVKFQENNPEVKDIPLNTIEENLGIGDTVHGNISGQKVSGRVTDIGVHKGQIVVDITDQNGNGRFLYSKNIERIEPKQKEPERLTPEQNKRYKELVNKEETTSAELSEMDTLGKIKRGEIPNPQKELPSPKQQSGKDVVVDEGVVDNASVSTKDKVFNKEDFVRDIDKLEKEKANGSKNIGLYSFKDKFVKLVKSKRKLSKENLNMLRDRVKDMDNVFPAKEIIDLPDGSQAIVMEKATGKIGNELTESEINNIPQEHWDKFESTIRELSKRGIQTDLTKRSNVLYDKDKGFQFIDLEGASIEGDATTKFFKKDGKEFYYDFEKYPFFPRLYKSAKEIFTSIGEKGETNAKGELNEKPPVKNEEAKSIEVPIPTEKEVITEPIVSERVPETEKGEGTQPFIEDKRTILSHRGLQEVATEFGFGDVTSREVKTDPQLFKDAENTSKKWVENGVYEQKINSLVEKAENAEVLTDEQRVILQQHIANVRGEMSGMDINSPQYNTKLSELNRLIRAGERTRSAAGAALRVPFMASVPNDLPTMLVEEMNISRVPELTPEQKATVQKEYTDISTAEKVYQQKIEALEAQNAKLRANRKVAESKSTSQKTKKTSEDFAKEREDIKKSIADKWNKAKNVGIVADPKNDLLIQIAPDVAKLVKSYVEEGVSKLEDIVAKVHDELKGFIPDLKQKDIHNIIAGDYNKKLPTKNQIAEQIENIRIQAKLVNKLESLLAGEEPKNEKRKIQRNAEIESLRQQIKEFKKEKLTPDQQALKALKTKMQKESEILKEQLRTGNYEKPEKKESIKLDAEALKMRDELIKLRQNREVRLMLQKRMNETKGQTALRLTAEVANIPRTLMTIGDYSGLLRQNIFFSAGHPLMSAAASKEMFKAGWSQTMYDRWFADLKDSPRYPIIEKSRLAIADSLSHDLTKREESFMSSLAEKIPLIGQTLRNKSGEKIIPGLNIVKGSERSYTALLNKMRVDMFNYFADSMEARGLTYENSPKVYDAMAEYINNATGRSDFGETLNRVAPVLNAAFFSPRLIASRVNMLTYWAQPRFWKTLPKEARIDYFRNWISLLAVGGTLMAVAKMGGADVEDDPRSSDFGKIKSGNTRWDIWGGAQPYVRVVAQVATGQRKSTNTGKMYELNGDDIFGETKAGVVTDFFRNKLAPVPGAAVDILSGRTGVGDKIVYQWGGAGDKEISLDQYIKQRLLPMTITGVQEAMKDQGVKALLTVGVPSTFGIGTQTYEKPKEKSKKPTKKSKPKKPKK